LRVVLCLFVCLFCLIVACFGSLPQRVCRSENSTDFEFRKIVNHPPFCYRCCCWFACSPPFRLSFRQRVIPCGRQPLPPSFFEPDTTSKKNCTQYGNRLPASLRVVDSFLLLLGHFIPHSMYICVAFSAPRASASKGIGGPYKMLSLK